MARQAVEWQRPSIEQALQDPAISGLGVLHVVVMHPSRPYALGTAFSEAVLHEASLGPRERWDVDYAALARTKARLSWEHGMDSRLLVQMQPHRLRPGDDPLWGSVWLDGLVVAASGAQPIWDEAFSLGIAAALRALAWERWQRAQA